ncbi:fructose-2,6-bisphosphatase [Belliella baltica DSM 15883]|uniref:Fructose-2,6-bisphosphatase n=1 Tax=Belliella baltica (strain DSM 15883 / CIP 108006 / LMG 21964 / BA134) TaxID=866536 RepID=I3Z6E3_BELBD|nr:histidine phosphatase family protein [Belliella baltica]AFL84811.1 fructose-2,6-bisphosphatase [Belliella baltica DSM 15883]
MFETKIENLVKEKNYIVRHGQTDYNLRGVVQGSGIDAPLNSNGLRQGKAFFDAYKEIPFEKVYYTGLQRTKQSVQGFLNLNIPSESIIEFNEISWGKYEGLPMTHDENEYYLQMLKRWSLGDLDYAIAGGESPNMVVFRLKIGLEKILNQPEKLILICMHGRAMRMLLSILMNYELKFMDEFKHQNLGLYELNMDDSGVFRILKYNSGAHLKGLELI